MSWFQTGVHLKGISQGAAGPSPISSGETETHLRSGVQCAKSYQAVSGRAILVSSSSCSPSITGPQAGLAVAQVQSRGSWAQSFAFLLEIFPLQVPECPANSGLTNADL